MATEHNATADLAFGDFRIDRADERLLGPGGPVRLGNKAFQVLTMLAEQDGRLLTKDALFASVWDGTAVSESALTSVIKELRRALGDESRTPIYIESVYGRGYRFLPAVTRGAATVAPEPQRAKAAKGEQLGAPPLLYIAPFNDAGIREAQPHLASMLREEILFALSRFRDIRLVSDAEPRAARGAEFGERDYQLSVTLLQDGAAAKAFARLSRLSSHAIIWADNIELTTETIGRVERLVRRITAAALPSLHEDVLRNLPSQPRDAYDLYFQTQLRMRGQTTLEEAKAVAAAWERLIASHPTFGQAYPPLIWLYNSDYGFTGFGSTEPKERARAAELARAALAIDPSEAHFHTVAGWSHLWAGDAPPATEHFEQALQLNPYNQGRLLEVATAFSYMDELERASALLERCRNLAPFATAVPHEEEGLLCLLQRDFASAAERLALVTRPTITSELFALVAAAASGAADAGARARRWQAAVERNWAGAEPLDEQSFPGWLFSLHPFQRAEHRAWILGLLRPLLSFSRG